MRMRLAWALLFGASAVLAEAQTMNMEEISRALGVHCDYCHSAPRGSGQAEPKKDIALAMMALTRDLNAKVQEATGKPANETARVECITCHRGVAIPQPLSAIILRTVAEKGGAESRQHVVRRKQDAPEAMGMVAIVGGMRAVLIERGAVDDLARHGVDMDVETKLAQRDEKFTVEFGH